jgi:competence protein ComEA
MAVVLVAILSISVEASMNSGLVLPAANALQYPLNPFDREHVHSSYTSTSWRVFPGVAAAGGCQHALSSRFRRKIGRGRRGWSRILGVWLFATGLFLAAMPVQAVNVNTATVEQLSTVRGVGPKTAQRIVKERERGGYFESLEDLSDRIRGIGLKRMQRLEAAGLRVEKPLESSKGQVIRPAASAPVRQDLLPSSQLSSPSKTSQPARRPEVH